MAMHRRHNPAAGGGGANPFTGRSLPAGRSAGGGGYHGNSPSLVPMAKKAVALLLTFVIFFYVIFAPEYDDGSYETNRQPSIKKKESASDAMNSSFVDLSKKPQTEPVKLNLPSEITPDPHDNNEVEREEEKQVESPDYEDQRIGDKEEEEEEEEQGMAYDSNDPDEQFKKSIGEDNESNNDDTTAELSPAEKIYGAHMHADETEPGSEDHSQSDPFLGLGDESGEKEDEEAALDNSRGGLRGSKSANNKDPFGRQETTDDDEKNEDEEEEQVVESSRDDPENIIEDETFYKNQSPLEVPNTVVEDDSTKSNHTKSMEDAINEHDTDIVAVITPCQDDPDFRYKGHEEHNCEYVSEREKCDKLHSGEKVGIVSCPVSCNMVNECLASLQEQGGSHVATKKNETNAVVRTFDKEEKFSSKEKAAFEAKYGSAHKSMEEEVNKQDALESDEFNNQAPLEIPVVDVSDVIELNQTEVAQSMKNSSGLSMEEDVDKQLKSMADEVEKEDKDSNDEDLKTKKTEDSEDDLKTVKKGLSDSHKVNTTTNDFDAEEENESNDEDNHETTKAKLDTSEVVVYTDGDSKVNKTASLVEENFKEYLITNSEDEPKKDEKNSEDREPSLEKNKDDEATFIVKDDIISKDDEGKEIGDEEGKAEDHDEIVKNIGSQDDSEQGEGADEDSKDKKAGVDKESVSVKGKIEDADELLKNSEGSKDALEQGEVADEVSKDKKTVVDKVSKNDSNEVETVSGDNEALESPKEVLASEVDETKESVAEDEEKAEDTDELLKNSDESNDALEQGEDADEDAEAKKTSSIRGAVDKQSKNDSQEVEKDLDLSPKGGKARKDDKKEESVVAEEEEAEDTDETVKNKRSTDASEKVDKTVKDSKAKKTKSIRGAADEKSSKVTQNAESTFEEGKQTAEDEFVKRSGDSSVQGDDAEEESKHKSIDSKDESQEVNTDLGNSQVLSNNGNETTSQIDKSEAASESVGGIKGSGDDKEEGGDDVDSKGKKVASIGSSLGDSVEEIDAVKDTEHIKTDPEDSADNKASKLVESEEKADESTAQNEDQESSDNLVGASRDKKDGESDASEKVKDDIKYAKIASEEPAAKKDASDKETGKKGKAKGSKTEDSPVGKDEKVIPILGDLGEAIKESDAPGSDEEAATDKNELGEAIKESDAPGSDEEAATDKNELSEAIKESDPPAIDEETATDKKDGVRSSKDDESVSPKENDEEVKSVAKGKDKTAKKDRKRKEKK
eukprot:scaffold12205_cov115-Skeletonema_dohrnii-CCMP3373.AAC.5